MSPKAGIQGRPRMVLRDEAGRRPVSGGRMNDRINPHRRDPPLFHGCGHGDCGTGSGAGHQGGRTGRAARAGREPLTA